jgi:hypothetical protein
VTYDEAEKEIKEYIDPKSGQVISLDGDFTASELEEGTPRG